MYSGCQRIMVQVAGSAWTQKSLERACILARSQSSQVLLVKMIPVQHIVWLGTELGNQCVTNKDLDQIVECRATAEVYGVRVSNHLFQYVTLPEAILQAAQYFDADVVFATLPPCLLPIWRQFQIWWLGHCLAGEHRILADGATSRGERAVYTDF